MKIQCILCREIVSIGAFETVDEGIRVRCAACGERFFLPRSGSREAARRIGDGGDSSDGDGGEGGEGAPTDDASGERASSDCPKCLQPVAPDDDACPSCGLLRERFDRFAAAAAADVPEDLEEAWRRCEESWDEEASHHAFLEVAAAGGRYAYAARRYREVLRARPGDEVAQHRLERISRMAEAAMMIERAARAQEEAAGTPYKGVLALLLVLLLAGGAVGIYLLTRSSGPDKARPVPARRVPAQPSGLGR